MTARMFLVDTPAWLVAEAGEEVHVSGPEGRHAVAVVRVRTGETVLLGGGGRRAEATVTHTGSDAFTARLLEVTVEPERDPRFVLVQALAKGGRDELAVETATELGVDEVVPWQASRSVVVWPDEARRVKGRARWEAVAAAAAKQARRARVPLVGPLADTDAVAARARDAALAVVLHEAATEPLATVPLPPRGDVLLVVGPEGGATDAELAAFREAGARSARLGTEVLRSSTAGPAAIAVLSARGRWA